jgi:hypothetical protein
MAQVLGLMERGIERGQRTEALSLFLRQLTRQIGSVASETQQQIEALPWRN